MLHVIVLLVVVGVMSSFVGAESIPEAVRRIDAKLQELERAGVGKPGPPGPQGARGPAGSQGPKGDAATLDKLDELALTKDGKRLLQLGVHDAGLGYVESFNRHGKRVAFMGGSSSDQHGLTAIYNKEGRRTLSLHGYPPQANFYNPSGSSVVFIGMFSNSPTGGAYFRDKDGKDRVSLGVHVNGKGFVFVNGTGVHDYAEILELGTREGISPGSVVAYDAKAGGLVPASAANARQVVGVISGAGGLSPGMVIGSRADESRDLPVSMSGVIHVRVSAEAGAVQPGDLLMPSSVPGVGMRAADLGTAGGRVFGKALEPWSGSGEGLVLMLVMNR